MGIRLAAVAERLRSSLFFVPLVLVVVGGVAGQLMIGVDASIDGGVDRLPFFLTSTVDSAREVLSVVAAATITFAGIAFSVSLLVIQQASSQYSPRVVHSLFRDPFNRRVMGVVVGIFTYCLIVLRAVRGPLEESGEPVIPNLSVGVAVLLGVLAILAIVAFIDHNAHSMEVSQILSRVADSTVEQVERTWPDRQAPTDDVDDSVPGGRGHVIAFSSSGWLQQVDEGALLELVPGGGVLRLETTVGRYAVRGTPLATVWPAPEVREDADALVADAVQLGAVRTMQQDPSYGVRQIVDVALVALSPGVNDPTTAQEAIFHLARVVREAFVRDLPPAVTAHDGERRIIRAEAATHGSLLALAFDEIRRAAAPHPTVCIYLLEALHLVDQSMRAEGLAERADRVRAAAQRIVDEVAGSGVRSADHGEVVAAFTRRFGPPRGSSSP